VLFCVESLPGKGKDKMNLCPPTPGLNLHSSLPTRTKLFQTVKVTFSFGFALLCLTLSLTNTGAQTREKRAVAASEERVRRVDENARASVDESGKVDNAKQSVVVPPSQVRKTALIYAPRTENQATRNPTLTNDIIIISRAPEAASVNRPLAVKAGAAASNFPSIWPVIGPLRSGVGMRSNPFGGSSIEFHKGQDIAAPTGTPVSATADGVVVVAGWVRGYGNGIYIDHGNGISTRYGHLSRIDVVVGQTIKQGQHLGLVGSTGRSTGPHLHYEVRINGQATNPLNYLPPLPAPLAHAAK
jgi:murein DD-endopeptidase MepM/ murein hydrolase activator NlpD